MKRLTVTLGEGAAKKAAAALARALPEVPTWQLREAFRRRDVKRGGERLSAGDAVAPGDEMTVYLPDAATAPLPIVFEDDRYIVISKRQGMPTLGEGSAEAAYARQMGRPLFACHRLDTQTGGLLLLAKDEAARAQAEAAFRAHQLQKTYQAWVLGLPNPREARLRAYLRKDARAARVTVLDAPAPGALPIETAYHVLRNGRDASLLEVDLVTGRTHQIRAHLQHLGHPVLGDDKYGDRAQNRRLRARQLMLWATGLVLWDGRAFTDTPEFGKDFANV